MFCVIIIFCVVGFTLVDLNADPQLIAYFVGMCFIEVGLLGTILSELNEKRKKKNEYLNYYSKEK